MKPWIAAVVIVVATRSAAAQPTPCEEYVELAERAHGERRYAEMLALLERAYTCKPEPSLLFSMGQAAFKLERYAIAEQYYLRFLDTGPSAEDDAVVRQALAVTRERRHAKPKIVVVRPRPADRLAWVLALTGGAALATSGGLYLYARRSVGDTEGSYAAYEARLDRAATIQHVAVGLAAVGTVLGGVAVLRWTLSDRSELVVGPTPGTGVAVTLGGTL